MNYIDTVLNKITMYRVVLYGLSVLAVLAIVFNALGLLLPTVTWVDMSLGLITLVAMCFISNYVLAKLFNAPTNVESNFISAFILFFILAPITVFSDLWLFAFVGLLAMSSKYLLAIFKKHIFNPIAIALVLVGIVGSGIASWWVASPIMLLPVLLVGFLVLRKIQRFSLFVSFIIAALAAIICTGVVLNHLSFASVVMPIFVSWPIIFFGTIMLTEPQTTPPTRRLQIIYGVLTGILFGVQFHIGGVYSSPELALILGNMFAYIVSPKQKLILQLQEKKMLADNTYEFYFTRADGKNVSMYFTPGQYVEWTLDHNKPDSRGNRRYFTIASSPTEPGMKIGIRTTTVNPSSFKRALLAMPKGGIIVASSLSGGFIMPKDTSKKLVFISGGIGVTPFRSMAQYLLDKHEQRDIVHFYSNKTASDIAYKDIFDRASQEVGMRTVYSLSDVANVPPGWSGEKGSIDKNMILKHVPEYAGRMYYISGPRGMVLAFEKMLGDMGVKPDHIRSDFFPGFA